MRKFLQKLRNKTKNDTARQLPSSVRSIRIRYHHQGRTKVLMFNLVLPSEAESRPKFIQIPHLASPEPGIPPYSALDAARQARGTPEPSAGYATTATHARQTPDVEHIHNISDAIPRGTPLQVKEQQRAASSSSSITEDAVKPVSNFAQLNVHPQLHGLMERSAVMAGFRSVDDFVASELSKRSPPGSNCYYWLTRKARDDRELNPRFCDSDAELEFEIYRPTILQPKVINGESQAYWLYRLQLIRIGRLGKLLLGFPSESYRRCWRTSR